METGIFERASQFLNSVETKHRPGLKKGDRIKKYTIGHKREAANYALIHGKSNAATKYNTSESNIYNWVTQLRNGLYENIPPDMKMITRKTKANFTKDTDEVVTLRAKVTALELMVTKLLDRLNP